MAKHFHVDLLCEDRGHEQFLSPLIQRIVVEFGLLLDLRVVSARGGAPRLDLELELFRKSIEFNSRKPDAIVIGQDGNCNGWLKTADQIKARLGSKLAHLLVPACPDPHVEKWYLADQSAFTKVVGGGRISLSTAKCQRDYYKRLLTKAIGDAGHFDGSGGLDFGPDLVAQMDIFATCRSNPDLASFVDGLRARAKAVAMP